MTKMCEYTLEEVFDEVNRRELAEFENPERHVFSLRHRKAMKKLFRSEVLQKKLAQIEKTAPVKQPKQTAARFKLPIKTRAILAVMLAFLAVFTLSTSATGSRFGMQLKVFHDHTEIYAYSTGGSPKRIEQSYSLPEIPEGYVLEEEVFVVWHRITFRNTETGRKLEFRQIVKNDFHFNTDTERYPVLEDIIINGYPGLYHDLSSEKHGVHFTIYWENQDYLFELDGYHGKDFLISLAESVTVI